MHMVLDHLLALRILVAQWATGQVEQGSVENQMSILADTSFGRRIEMAKESGLLSGEEVADLTEINRIRNSLLHYKPKLKEGSTTRICSSVNRLVRIVPVSFPRISHIVSDQETGRTSGVRSLTLPPRT